MQRINFRTLTAALISSCLCLTLAGASAHAATQIVRWRHPNPEDVEAFSVHIGYSPGNYVDSLTKYFIGYSPDDYVNILTKHIKRIEADADGVFQVAINVESDRQLFIAVRAYNDEAMSPFSNETDLYQSTSLGTPGRPRLVNSLSD